jgi:succinyl-CoA synthetase alpha subunit
MGHAGAIISGGQGTAAEKYKAMRAAGIRTVQSPAEIGHTMAAALGKSKARAKPAAKKKAGAAKSKKAAKKKK